MQLFVCQSCGARLYFENRFCQSCNHSLGYLPDADVLMALVRPAESNDTGDGVSGLWQPLVAPERRMRFCVNARYDACNWLVPANGDATEAEPFCKACRFNRIVPDLNDATNLARWRKIETAKHWLIYTLSRLGLPMPDRKQDPAHGLAFDFLSPLDDKPPPLTGHDEGVIVLNVEEAEDAIRESNRAAMGEPYRTLLGHFRHEIGHFYWDILVRDADNSDPDKPNSGKLDACRAIFGDDREDYAAALERHYAEGAPPDWQNHFISAYASSHPWEDFAETWAHYLHIVDTIETATAYGLRVRPPGTAAGTAPLTSDFDPYRAPSIEDMIEVWLPLSFAMNSLARSMGQPDLYPFILSPPVIDKLGFIHNLVKPRG
ncbi:MAG: putative zinc-binding metallopeptidase [Acidiphilium sp.]|nr:putative zinc-binding metallopeptidase [Acidiphilium sp.]MDD4936060.1 putative zinc-binding metallopeptidase [Acidiphilium sp.]